jgi:hypothetical protein
MSCSGFDPAPPPRISTPPDVGPARAGHSPRVVSALVLDDAFSRRLISAPRRSLPLSRLIHVGTDST